MAIALGSLRGGGGHRAMLNAPAGDHNLTVTAVCVRHAAALKELVRGDRWTCLNVRYLSRLVRADAILVLIETSVLPSLCDHPTDVSWIRELRRCGDRLKSVGKKVGGSFRARTTSLSKRIKDHAADCTHVRRSLDALGHRGRRLCNSVTALRDARVTISTA